MTAVTALPSRYVKRCVRCRVVKGRSSFKGRYREMDVCRNCAEFDNERKRNGRKLAGMRERHDALLITVRVLRQELKNLTAAIREIEAAAPTVGGIVPKQRSA